MWSNVVFCAFLIFAISIASIANGPTIDQISPKQLDIAAIEQSADELSKEWSTQGIQRAISLYSEASEEWTEINEFEHADECIRKTADLYLVLGRSREAANLLERLLEREGRASRLNQKVETLALLSVAKLRIGDIKNALFLSERALTLSRNQSNDRGKFATALFAHGLVIYEDGDFLEATRVFERALALWEAEGNTLGQTKTLVELAYAYMTNDRFSEGLEAAEKALSKATEANNLQYKALARNAIGVLKSKLGKKQEALALFLQSEREFPDGVNALEKGDMLNHLAELYLDFAELRLSRRYREKALEVFRRENNPFAQLATLPKLGQLIFVLGEEEAGLEYFEEGFRIARELNNEFYVAVLNQDLGNLYFETDQVKALDHFNIALKLFDKIKIKQHFVIIQNSMGLIYQNRGNLALARKMFDASLNLSRETHNIRVESETYFNLAKLNLLENNFDGALANAAKSLDLADSYRSDVDMSNLRRSFFSNANQRYEFYVGLLMSESRRFPIQHFEVLALRALERSRSRDLLETLRLSESTSLRDANSDLVRKEMMVLNELNAKLNELNDGASASVGAENLRKLETEISDLQQELEKIKAELRQKSPIYSAIKNPEPFDVADFQANVLGDDDVLLEFSLGKDESYLWAVDKRDVTPYYLPPREQIEARVDKLRVLIGSRQLKPGETFDDYQRRVADAEIEYKAEARILSSALLGQVPADKLAGKRLIVVADGRLHYFPLGSLPMPGVDSDEPILLANEVVYEPSASALKIFRMEKKAEAKPQKDLLVFADPVFSKTDERIAGLDTSNQGFVSMIFPSLRSIESLESMPRLPASEEEAKSIADVVGANQTTVRAGFAANRDGVLNGGIEDYKILHFATHGLIDETRPELSGILLSLYSDGGEKTDGGFIRLQDVYGLRLNSDLVVLSACDTGIGKEIKGEGVMSLNNAFLQAGARSVVSSLWKVDDNATKDLMTEFYRGMADDGLTAAAALRHAQIKMFNDPRYRSPFYWAAFTASGDAGVKVAFTSYAWLYTAIAAAVITVSVLTFLTLRRLTRRRRAEKLRFSVTG